MDLMRIVLYIRSNDVSRAVVGPLLGTPAPDSLLGGSVVGVRYAEEDGDDVAPAADTHVGEAAGMPLADAEQPTASVVSCRCRFSVCLLVSAGLSNALFVLVLCVALHSHEKTGIRLVRHGAELVGCCTPPLTPCRRLRTQQASSQRGEGVSRVAATEGW